MLLNQRLPGFLRGVKFKSLYHFQSRKQELRSASLSIMMLLLFVLLTTHYHDVLAATISSWEVVPDNQITVKLTKPIHTRHSKDSSVVIKLSNVSDKALAGPFRLIITGLPQKTKTKVSISNATGKTVAGEPYYDLTGYIGTNFSPAGTGIVTVIIKGDNSKGNDHKTFRFKTRVERQVIKIEALVIKITSPATLLTVGSTKVDPSVQTNNILI